MNTKFLTPYHPQYWFHPQLQLYFSEPYSLFFKAILYTISKFTPLLLYPTYLSIIKYYLQLYPTSNIIGITHKATVSPSYTVPKTICSFHHVPLPILPIRKTPAEVPSFILTTQLYTSVYFIRSITPPTLYTTLCLLYQSWWKHTCSLTPLRNESNPILTFKTHSLPSSCTHPPITIQMTRVKYLFCLFQIILLITHVNKIPIVFLFGTYPQEYIYYLKDPTSVSPLQWCQHQNYTNPAFPTIKYHAFSTYFPSYIPLL